MGISKTERIVKMGKPCTISRRFPAFCAELDKASKAQCREIFKENKT